MMEIRAIGGDWQSFASLEDYKNKKEDIEKIIRDYPRRPVPPTPAQVALVRRLMHTVYDSRAEGMPSWATVIIMLMNVSVGLFSHATCKM
jgi:hypothetical protein